MTEHWRPVNGCDHTRVELVRKCLLEYEDNGDLKYGLEYESVSAYRDIGQHRLRCSECKQIAYYSQRARVAWETGVHDQGIRCFVTPIEVPFCPR